jgi:hypothetical protein
MSGKVSQPSGERSAGFTEEQILQALRLLNEELTAVGVIGELCLFGGAVMVLAFKARLSTKDVDAVFEPAALVRQAAARVAEASELPATWLNDGVKGYLSTRHETVRGALPQFSNLRLTMPTAEYLLAMKCLASRIGSTVSEADDTADIVLLIRHLQLPSAQAVLDLVTAYYPPERVPVKAQFLVETLFEERRV